MNIQEIVLAASGLKSAKVFINPADVCLLGKMATTPDISRLIGIAAGLEWHQDATVDRGDYRLEWVE